MTNLEQEQAAMYRWIRARMSRVMLNHLTGKINDGPMSDLEVDRLLRTAFELYQIGEAGDRMVDRAQVRAGILPETLGQAILNYAAAVADDATFHEGLGGRTYKDVQDEVTAKFMLLCQEMANLR